MTSGTRYSFGGNITKSRQVLPGGYISFANPESNELQQILFLGSSPERRNLGPASGLSLRVFVDGHTNALVDKSRKSNQSLAKHGKEHRKIAEAAALKRAKSYSY